jgi:hypothetical protein
VGQYSDLINCCVDGYLVNDWDEWPQILLELSDDDRRREMSQRAFTTAQGLTIQGHARDWEAAFE